MILYREDGNTIQSASELRISPAAASKVIKRMEQDRIVSRMTEAPMSGIRVSCRPRANSGDKSCYFQQMDNHAGRFSDREIQELFALGKGPENLQKI